MTKIVTSIPQDNWVTSRPSLQGKLSLITQFNQFYSSCRKFEWKFDARRRTTMTCWKQGETNKNCLYHDAFHAHDWFTKKICDNEVCICASARILKDAPPMVLQLMAATRKRWHQTILSIWRWLLLIISCYLDKSPTIILPKTGELQALSYVRLSWILMYVT